MRVDIRSPFAVLGVHTAKLAEIAHSILVTRDARSEPTHGKFDLAQCSIIASQGRRLLYKSYHGKLLPSLPKRTVAGENEAYIAGSSAPLQRREVNGQGQRPQHALSRVTPLKKASNNAHDIQYACVCVGIIPYTSWRFPATLEMYRRSDITDQAHPCSH